ncbi:MAG: repeat-containing protein [Pedosphaera sp.]|nr:repeat-containing protein [Pedosphaera sp.]
MKKLGHLVFVSAVIALLGITGGCSKEAKRARHMERAERHYAAGDYNKAEIEYINTLRIDQTKVDATKALAYERLGTMSLEQGRLSRAYGALVQACKWDTNNLDFRYQLGLIYLHLGKFKEARGEANFILDRRAQDEQAPLLLADASTTPKDIDASRQRLQKLAIPQAKRAAVEVALGNLSLRQRDIKTAGEAFARAKLADPNVGA